MSANHHHHHHHHCCHQCHKHKRQWIFLVNRFFFFDVRCVVHIWWWWWFSGDGGGWVGMDMFFCCRCYYWRIFTKYFDPKKCCYRCFVECPNDYRYIFWLDSMIDFDFIFSTFFFILFFVSSTIFLFFLILCLAIVSKLSKTWIFLFLFLFFPFSIFILNHAYKWLLVCCCCFFSKRCVLSIVFLFDWDVYLPVRFSVFFRFWFRPKPKQQQQRNGSHCWSDIINLIRLPNQTNFSVFFFYLTLFWLSMSHLSLSKGLRVEFFFPVFLFNSRNIC